MSKFFSKIFQNFFSKIKTNLISGCFSPFLAVFAMVLVKIFRIFQNFSNFFFFSKSKQTSFLAILAHFRPFQVWFWYENFKIRSKFQTFFFQKWPFFGRFRAVFGYFQQFWPKFKFFFFAKLAIFGHFSPFCAIFGPFLQFFFLFSKNSNFGYF